MRHLVVLGILLFSNLAFGAARASCEVQDRSVSQRTASGVAQVSNLGRIEMICRFPARPFPSKPGESRMMARVETSVYEISLDGIESLVPSKVNPTGGDSDLEMEGVVFDLAIPLDPTALKIEADDIFAALERSARDEVEKEAFRRLWNDPEMYSRLVTEHRAGHFRVESRIVDGTRVLGIGSVELQVLFDGRFSDRYLEMMGSR